MIELLKTILFTAKSTVKTHRELALENLALRQQLAAKKTVQEETKIIQYGSLFLDHAISCLENRLFQRRPESMVKMGFAANQKRVSLRYSTSIFAT
jgi:hypothetical protein